MAFSEAVFISCMTERNFMGRLADYLNDTFQPPNEHERAYEWRLFKQRMVLMLIALILCAIMGGLHGLSVLTENRIMQGTWILLEDYEDGFHPEDTYLEYKKEQFYRNGKRYGRPKRQDDQLVLPIRTAMRTQNRILTFQGDTMIMEYRVQKTYTIPSEKMEATSPYSGLYGPGSTYALVNEIIQDSATNATVKETYIRISPKYDLSPEERDSLY